MTKKHFIALADAVKAHNEASESGSARFTRFTDDQLRCLSIFCRAQNYNFDTERWHDYIAGKCGPNGGYQMNRRRNKETAAQERIGTLRERKGDRELVAKTGKPILDALINASESLAAPEDVLAQRDEAMLIEHCPETLRALRKVESRCNELIVENNRLRELLDATLRSRDRIIDQLPGEYIPASGLSKTEGKGI